MSYTYLAAFNDYGPRKATRAIVYHFTEGNGGWGDAKYIASPTVARGVSANFVILGAGAGADDGLIVQMLPWTHAAGSINPALIRTDDDAPFTSPDGVRVVFGATAAKAALGDLWSDPNGAAIAVELAGKAADGPSAKQMASIVALTKDVRSRYGAGTDALGHRDFQSYKACPGKLIRWGEIGGHGAPVAPARAEEDFVKLDMKLERWVLDGGPARVTTLGAPVGSNGVDLSQRLAYFGPDRLELISRDRLGATASFDATIDDGIRTALGNYTLPAGGPAPDCTQAVTEATQTATADEKLRWTTWLSNAPL